MTKPLLKQLYKGSKRINMIEDYKTARQLVDQFLQELEKRQQGIQPQQRNSIYIKEHWL